MGMAVLSMCLVIIIIIIIIIISQPEALDNTKSAAKVQ
jgi:hypothetical protein